MDYINMSMKELVATAIAFADHQLCKLGYNDISFNQIYSYDGENIRAMFSVSDDFQSHVSYHHQCQHGTLILDFPLSLHSLKNREQRELSVMLAQQGESTALRNLMISAAGRRFVETLCEERAKYAQLCDMRSNPEAPF